MAVTQDVQYTGELHCELTHGPSGATLETDAPTDNAGRGESFSPTDLVGSALASCAITTMAIKAPAHGISFGASSAKVVKEMTTEPPRRVARLTVAIQMPDGLHAGDRAQLEEIAKTCPVALSLSDAVELDLSFHYPD